MKKIIDKTQIGRSMVEMLGVLAIIGVLSVGAIAGYNMAMEKYRINQVLDAIPKIVQEINIIYEDEEFLSGLGSSRDSGSLASKIIENLDINIYYDWELLGLEGGYKINFSELPESSCVVLMSQNWSVYGDGKTAVDINMRDSYSIGNAVEDCKDDHPYGTGEISFYFSKNGLRSIENIETK